MSDFRLLDYWETLDEDAPERETVLDRIAADLDDLVEIHAVCPTTKRGETVYCLVSYSRENDGGTAVDVRTVAVDLGDESVRVTSNGLWVPDDPGVLAVLSKAVGAARGLDDGELVTGSAVDGISVDSLLSHTVDDEAADDVEDDRNDRTPPEAYTVDERLQEAGISTEERYNRLAFGGKDPWDHELRDTEGLLGNYGVYATSDDDLVLVDVDDPEALDEDLPTTFVVTSPHGSAERCHRYYRLSDPETWRETFGKHNLAADWGEVRTANQYVVGPGSQLDGCDKDPCSGSPPCSDPDGGQYEIILDREIETVETEDLLPALEECLRDDEQSDADGEPGAEAQDDPGAGVDQDSPEDASGGSQETVTCHECGRLLLESEASLVASTEDREFWQCARGCPQ